MDLDSDLNSKDPRILNPDLDTPNLMGPRFLIVLKKPSNSLNLWLCIANLKDSWYRKRPKERPQQIKFLIFAKLKKNHIIMEIWPKNFLKIHFITKTCEFSMYQVVTNMWSFVLISIYVSFVLIFVFRFKLMNKLLNHLVRGRENNLMVRMSWPHTIPLPI